MGAAESTKEHVTQRTPARGLLGEGAWSQILKDGRAEHVRMLQAEGTAGTEASQVWLDHQVKGEEG